MIVSYVGADTKLVVDGDRIADAGAQPDLEIDIGTARAYPGLINSHDHLQLNHYPRLGNPPYRSMYDWGRDIHESFGREIEEAKAVSAPHAFLFGALKNLMGGVTTVVHHDVWHESLKVGFPIKTVLPLVAHSLGFEPDIEALSTVHRNGSKLLSMHIAEGTDPELEREIERASELGLLDDRFLGVHAIAVDSTGIEIMAAAGVAVVWCPSSNDFLFGRTISPDLASSEVDLLLGTDSLLTGAGTLLEEMSLALDTGLVSDDTILDAVGPLATRRLGLPAPGLETGSVADVVFFEKHPLGASPADVDLVLVDGEPRLAIPDFAPLFEAFATPYGNIDTEFGVRVTTYAAAEAWTRITQSGTHRTSVRNP